MTVRSKHIISSLGWQTTFSVKDRSADLQNRLSRWSRWKLPDELQSLLDTLCPEDQTWQIDQLHLDLGAIDYNDLENELSATITKTMREVLHNLLYRQLTTGDTTFQIIHSVTTDLETLGYFLLNGYMPWNHNTGNAGFNKLFSHLLTHHTQATVQLIRDTGKDNPVVRKRIAWQTEEPVLHQLVKGLEPVHHTEIISFTKEMAAMQQQKNLVTAAQHGFRKNLWNWILNYLLEEKDTVFNKLAFVKSSLRQMAAHYNIAYEELLMMTTHALEIVKKKMQLRTDLGRTLALLAQQLHTAIPDEQKQQGTHSYWEEFRLLLTDDSRIATTEGKEKFNALLPALIEADKKRLLLLIYPLGYSSKKWRKIAAILSDESLEVLFTGINPVNGRQWLYILQWLRRSVGQTIISGADVILREAGIKFLLRHQRSSSANESFASYCASQLARQTGIKAGDILSGITDAAVISNIATLQEAEIISAMQLHFFRQKCKAKGTTSYITSLLQHVLAAGDNIPEAQQATLQNKLRQLFFTEPDAFLDALIRDPQKRKIVAAVLNSTAPYDTQVLLHQSSHIHARLIRDSIVVLSRTFDFNPEISGWIKYYLPGEALKLIVEQPAISAVALLRKLVKAMLLRQNVVISENSEEILAKLSDGVPASSSIRKIVHALYIKDQASLHPDRQINIWLRTAANKKTDRRILAERIQLCRQQPVFSRLVSMAFNDSQLLMEKLVPGSTATANQLSAYLGQLHQQKGFAITGRQQTINKLFWKLLIETAIAGKDSGYLRAQMEKAAMFLFPEVVDGVLQLSARTKHISAAEKRIPSIQDALTPELLLRHLQPKAVNATTGITIPGRRYTTKAFFEFLVSVETDTLVNTIQSGSRLPDLESQLNANVQLNEFIWWTSGAVPQGQSALLGELQLLLTIAEKLFPATKAYVQKRGWALALAIIRGNIRTNTSLQRIARELIRPLLVKTVPDTAEILSVVKPMRFATTSPVRLALQELLPELTAKLTVKNQHETLELFQRLSAKGLLSELIHSLFTSGEMPHWFQPENDKPVQEWAYLLITQQPAPVLKALRRAAINGTTSHHFKAAVPFNGFIQALQQAWPQQAASLRIVQQLYEALSAITIQRIPSPAIQDMLYRLLIRLFRTDARGSVDPDSLWKQLMIELGTAYAVRPVLLQEAMQQYNRLLPPAIHAANELLLQEQSATVDNRIVKKTSSLPDRRQLKKIRKGGFDTVVEKIAVKNAGLVIINMYLPILFKRLGLMENDQFISPEHQQDAVHYLQYLAAAQHDSPEEYLVLNKILCGLPLESPVKDRIEITPQNKETIEGLISAVVNYWPVIGETSVDGFRGNWLVRDGLVHETEENWYLTVEKRPYDVLLGKSPFSFSVIRYPWMSKPLKTEWPF